MFCSQKTTQIILNLREENMATNIMNALEKNFLGSAPKWYKQTIIAFLIINPVLFELSHPFLAAIHF